MCGIVGKITNVDSKISPSELRLMAKSLEHRGPDGKGEFFSNRVGLAMRRLAIIDIKGGNQPLSNENGTIQIVGNGEIYNYLELQKDLRKRHKLKTKNDIETVVHLYEELGLDCVRKLRGMFALALLDKKKNRVILFRDRLGEKPLYYSKVKDGLVFASELKSLLKAKGVDKSLNFEGIDKFFHFQYIPEPETIFSSVRKLKNGSLLSVDLETMTSTEIIYWDTTKIKPTSSKRPTEEIKETFAQACELTLRSDVPVGIALSGGIDSSSILSYTAPKYKDTLKAFCIGYEGTPPSDERYMAKDLSQKLKVEFFEKEIKDSEVVDNFPEIVHSTDDPISEIASFSIYSVSKLAREKNIKVLLAGVGGDELFWGYPWVSKAINFNIEKRDFLNNKIVKSLMEMTKTVQKPRLFYPLLKTLINLLSPENQLILNSLRPGFKRTENFLTKFYHQDFISELTPYHCFRFAPYQLAKAKDGEISKTIFDILVNGWLISDVITINERLSMANSVELRSPFLDYKLFETVLTSTRAMQANKFPQKYWFKEAIKDVLPKEILDRSKRGFTPPARRWIQKIIAKYIYLLEGGFLVENKILDEKRLSFLKRSWWIFPFYWFQIFQLIALEVWCREYIWNEEIKIHK